MPVVTCVEDLRELSRKRVARAIFDYVDRGSYSEGTLRANRADLESLALRQRVGIDVDRRSLRTSRPSMVVRSERRSTSMPTRWRSASDSRSARLARSVPSV